MSSQNRFRLVVGDGPTIVLEDGEGTIVYAVEQIDCVQEGDAAQQAIKIIRGWAKQWSFSTRERREMMSELELHLKLDKLGSDSRVRQLLLSFMRLPYIPHTLV